MRVEVKIHGLQIGDKVWALHNGRIRTYFFKGVKIKKGVLMTSGNLELEDFKCKLSVSSKSSSICDFYKRTYEIFIKKEDLIAYLERR